MLRVELNQRFSSAVKYLTQSTWSHAPMCFDPAPATGANDVPLELIGADLEHGVTAVSLSKYEGFNTRIHRPVGLNEADSEEVARFMVDSVGLQHDLQNVIDLARYLLRTPPVPVGLRRRNLAFGSGDPRALFAQRESRRHLKRFGIRYFRIAKGRPNIIMKEHSSL